MQPIVYIPQDNARLNLSPALGFGRLDSFASVDCPITRIPQTYEAIKEWLCDFRSNVDYLMLIGDPILISLCVAYLVQTKAKVQVLKWDRQEKKYIPLVLECGPVPRD